MRINKYLAQQGFASRRAIDELISEGKIKVNNEIVSPGFQLNLGDEIKVQGKTFIYTDSENEKIYIALYKPVGVTSSCSEDDRDNVIAYLMNEARYAGSDSYTEILRQLEQARLYPVGRLDKNSQGLILLTNDGELTQRLTHPSFEHEKEYLVTVEQNLTRDFLEEFASGVEIAFEDGSYAKTLPCLVKKIDSRSFTVVLKQGLNRQIRRMTHALGNEVEILVRSRIARLELSKLKLKEGEFKLINSDDIM